MIEENPIEIVECMDCEWQGTNEDLRSDVFLGEEYCPICGSQCIQYLYKGDF